MKKLLATMVVAAVMAPASAFAIDVPFTGTVDDTCTLTLNNNGEMVANADATVLSSKASGGTAGQVGVVVNSGAFTVAVSAPGGWTTPVSNPGATFVADMDVDGVTDQTSHALTTAGSYTADVDLVATTTGVPFPADSYSAVVTFTCTS